MVFFFRIEWKWNIPHIWHGNSIEVKTTTTKLKPTKKNTSTIQLMLTRNQSAIHTCGKKVMNDWQYCVFYCVLWSSGRPLDENSYGKKWWIQTHGDMDNTEKLDEKRCNHTHTYFHSQAFIVFLVVKQWERMKKKTTN